MKSYIYRFIDKNQKIVYVGKTNNLTKRYNQHFRNRGHLTKECYNSVWKVEYIKVDSELNALLLETYYINKYRPKYNKLNKTYRPTNIENVNLKEIKDNWKLYRIVNGSLQLENTEKKMSRKEKIINLSTGIIILIFIFLWTNK